MSWISGLADKAENILNKIDQNAATALQLPIGSEPTLVPPSIGMRKSLSSSTISQSFKAKLSPSPHSVKSEGSTVGMEDSVDSADKLEWSVYDEIATSRKSSISSKTDCVTIDLALMENVTNPKSTQTTTAPQASTTIAGEVGQELAAFKIALSEVSSERDELRCKLAALNRDLENAGLKQRVEELESWVQQLSEEREQDQQKLNDAQLAGNAYVHSISELETNLAKLQQVYLDTAHKLQLQIKETEQHRYDLEQYRTKAQRALQLKDRLIEELKGQSTPKTDASSDTRVANLEFDALRQEHKQLLEENQSLASQLEQTRQDMNELSKKHAEQLVALRSNEEMLHLERERTFAAESQYRVLTQELELLRKQLTKTEKTLNESNAKVQQLSAAKCRPKVENKDRLVEEYDMRLRTLTQALVVKQSDVEKITAERNALRIQLEKLEDEMQKRNYNSRLNESLPRNSMLLNSTDDAKAQFPMLLKENPFDNRIARRFKRAYSSLDSAGIRLGAFLRRYPLMRISVLMYVGLLHIWVVLVLFLSTPQL